MDQIIDMKSHFCLVFTAPEKWRVELRAKTGHYGNRCFTTMNNTGKNDTEKKWKKFKANVWKIIFSLTFNSMESYHPEHLLVYFKFLKNSDLWRTYSTSGIGLLQDPRFITKRFLIDNSVRRLLLLNIVLHSLFADAIDGLRPNAAYADPY